VTRLLDAIGSEPSVAVSRLADEAVYAAIDASDVELIEVPHSAGVPLVEPIVGGVVRVRHWPNVAGYLESGNDRDVVVWWRSLAPAPDSGTVVTAGPPQAHDIEERTNFLDSLIKRLEQNRGVSRVCETRAARGIIYTPGLETSHIEQAAQKFPGAIRKTPKRLSEFPGGICLRVTPEVWRHPDSFGETVGALISEACLYRSPIKVRRR